MGNVKGIIDWRSKPTSASAGFDGELLDNRTDSDFLNADATKIADSGFPSAEFNRIITSSQNLEEVNRALKSATDYVSEYQRQVSVHTANNDNTNANIANGWMNGAKEFQAELQQKSIALGGKGTLPTTSGSPMRKNTGKIILWSFVGLAVITTAFLLIRKFKTTS